MLERALQALAAGDLTRAATELKPIAYAKTSVAKPGGLKRSVQGRILRRDRFHCRYCGARVIPTPIMELLGEVFTERFPYHPNWKGGETHPAVLSRTAVIDHVEPAAWGGTAADDNLVTACWPCNARKADLSLTQLGWQRLPVNIDDEWDGLTRFYSMLWHRARCPKPKLHHDWASALAVTID